MRTVATLVYVYLCMLQPRPRNEATYVCLTVRGHCLLVCRHKRYRSCYQRSGEGLYPRERQEARSIHLDHGPARFQAIKLRWPDSGVNDERSVLLGRRFFLSRVQKNKRNKILVAHPLLQNLFHLKLYLMKILQHENFPIYGIRSKLPRD